MAIRSRVLDVRRQDGRLAELSISYVEEIAEAMPGLKLVIIDVEGDLWSDRGGRDARAR